MSELCRLRQSEGYGAYSDDTPGRKPCRIKRGGRKRPPRGSHRPTTRGESRAWGIFSSLKTGAPMQTLCITLRDHWQQKRPRHKAFQVLKRLCTEEMEELYGKSRR